MHTAAHEIFEDLSSPVAIDAAAQDRLGSAWRYSLREVEGHIRFISQHLNTIAQRDDMLTATVRRHSEKYIAAVRQQLAHRLPLYAAAVRRVTEYELRMNQIGMAFARSSYAWEL